MLIFNQRSLQEILDVILIVGRIVGAEDRALRLIDGYVRRLSDAEVAVFITNVEGEISGVSCRGLQMVPVEFVK